MSRLPNVQQLIIDDITSGVLAFGARLTIDDLASRYGVSHMPIREALRQLSGAGLLEIGSGRTARVREISAEFVENLFATRSALEVMLARRAAQFATVAGQRDLELLEERLEAGVEAGDDRGVLEANHAFHRAINAMARNPEAVALVDRQWILITALWGRVGYGPERFTGMISDHRHLMRAIAATDIEAAGAIMGAHVIKAQHGLLERLSRIDLSKLRAA